MPLVSYEALSLHNSLLIFWGLILGLGLSLEKVVQEYTTQTLCHGTLED